MAGKKLLIPMVALALLVVSCGPGGNAGQPVKIKVGVSHYAYVIGHYRAMTEGIKDEAKKFGWDVVVVDSGFSPEKQVSQIENLIAQHVNIILASPGDKQALVPAYLAAKRAGVPIFSLGNEVAPPGDQNQLTWVGIQWDPFGVKRAQAIVDRLRGKGKVILIRGPSGVDFVQQITVGMNRVWQQNPGIQIVTNQFATDFTPAVSLRLAEDALTAHPDADLIYVEDDGQVPGVVQAIRERGIPAGKILIQSSGGQADAMQLIRSGALDATYAVHSYGWGVSIMEAAKNYLVGGKKPPPFIAGSYTVVNSGNVDDYLTVCQQFPKEISCAP